MDWVVSKEERNGGIKYVIRRWNGISVEYYPEDSYSTIRHDPFALTSYVKKLNERIFVDRSEAFDHYDDEVYIDVEPYALHKIAEGHRNPRHLLTAKKRVARVKRAKKLLFGPDAPTPD